MDEFHLLLSFFLPCLVWTLPVFVVMGCIRSCFASDGDDCTQCNSVKVSAMEEKMPCTEEHERFLQHEVTIVNATDTVRNIPKFKTQQLKGNVAEYEMLEISANESSQLKKHLEESQQKYSAREQKYDNDLKVKQEQLSRKEDEVITQRKEHAEKIEELETKHKESLQQITDEAKMLINENSQLKEDLKKLHQQHSDNSNELKEQLSNTENEQIKERKETNKKIGELQELETKNKEEYQILKTENSELKVDIENFKQEVKELKEQLANKEDEMSKKMEQVQELETKHKEKSKGHEEEKVRLGKEIEDLKTSKEIEIRKIVDERNKTISLYNALKRQKSTYETAKYAYKRQGIQNMNDEFSNSKLAERFSDIEKEEWLNAFESLQEGQGEMSAIEKLSLLLKQGYTACIERSNDVTRILLGLNENDSLPSEIESNIFEARREQLQHAHITKEIVENILRTCTDSHESSSAALQLLLNKYVECCLLLVITEPQIELNFDVKGMCYNGELKRRFNKYSTDSSVERRCEQADTIIAVVWPELDDHCSIHRKGIIVSVDKRLDF